MKRKLNQSTLTVNEELSDDSNLIDNSNWIDLPFAAVIGLKEEISDDYPPLNSIQDHVIREEVRQMIRNYVPKKIKESPIELKIMLTDDIPVFQRARRLPSIEKEALDRQIKEWLQNNIIRTSQSEYAV